MEMTDMVAGMSRVVSTADVVNAARTANGKYALLLTRPCRVVPRRGMAGRMARVADDTGAVMVYSHYRDIDNGRDVTLIDCQTGALRDDFDFGPVVMVSVDALRRAADDMAAAAYRSAGFYDLRLRLMEAGPLVRIPETLYDAGAAEESSQFDYVDPRNRAAQIEREEVVTSFLHRTGAWIDGTQAGAVAVDAGNFPVEASVVIPVRNRVSTIADAVRSALAQEAPFSINVIAVDNYSTDGTAELLARIASQEPRLVLMTPEHEGFGIGGCWNLALSHPLCGRFAVQLDSDDVYSRPDAVKLIVDKFRERGCAMVVGSYRLTDFKLNTIPPGLIDHAEWTDGNGSNNLLRVNGVGAPRAFFTPVAREFPMPDVSYGEDYAMALRLSRSFRIGRIFDELYLCRRWDGNSDAAPDQEKINRFNEYKDRLRTWELSARRMMR